VGVWRGGVVGGGGGGCRIAAHQFVVMLVNNKYGYFANNCVSKCINLLS
jgi:hypothetical protein